MTTGARNATAASGADRARHTVSRSPPLQRAESRAADRQPPCKFVPRARVRDQAGGPRETRARWRRKRRLILAVQGSTISPCLA